LGLCDINESDKPDHWCINSWTQCIKNLEYEADVAFLGNSITAGSNFHEHFPDIKVIEFGYSGDRVDGMTKRVPMLQAVNAKKVFIMGGINDLHRSSPQTVFKRYDKLLQTIRKALPEINIYVQSILPVSREKEKKYATNDVIKETNALIQNIAKKYNCTYIDLNSIYIENGVNRIVCNDEGVRDIYIRVDSMLEYSAV
jgi:lysophospholipase L1-like esterase